MMNRVFPKLPAPSTGGASRSADAVRGQADDDDGSSWQDLFRDPSAMLGRHPVVTVGVGLCFGIAVGLWVKRR